MTRNIGEGYVFPKLSTTQKNSLNPLIVNKSNPAKAESPFTVKTDTVSFKGKDYLVKKQGKILQVVSFTGIPELPQYGIKVKVRGVMRFQKNCQKVLEGNWKDGDALVMRRKTYDKGDSLEIIHPQYGMLGRIPEEVTAKLLPLLDKGHNLNVELSDVVGGVAGASTIGLRVNVLYDIDGNNKIENMGIYNTWKYKDNNEKLFQQGKAGDELIIKPEGREMAVYHKTFGRIGDIYNKDVSLIKDAIKDNTYKASISSIAKGSKKYPDTVFIKFNFENTNPKELKDVPAEVSKTMKSVTSEEDTKNLSFPYQPVEPPERLLNVIAPKPVVGNIINEINKAKNILLVGHRSPDGDTIGSVLGLNGALKAIGKKVECCIDDDIPGAYRHKMPGLDENIRKARDLDQNKKYDLVILMDTPTPARVGGNSRFVKTAKKVIFIDHHPMRKDEWLKLGKDSGVDPYKIDKEGLLWVRDDIPAAAEMVAGLVFKLVPKQILDSLTPEQKKNIAIPLVNGMMTDTSNFARGADQKVESFAKYLMEWAGFGKKWLRDNIRYNIPTSAREKMVQYATEGVTVEKDIKYGSLRMPFDKFMEIFNEAKKQDPDVVKQDIINEIKFSEIFSSLRTDPKTFDDDNIAALLIQKSGKEVDGEDSITMSFRSGEGKDFARKIAEQLGGGGHNGAAGASAIGHDIEAPVYDSKTGEKITLERKIAEMARELRQQAVNNVVNFTGWLNKIKKAS